MNKQQTVTSQHCRCCNGIYKTNKWHATGILRARDRRGSAIRTSQSGSEEPQQLGLHPALNRRRVPSPHQWNDHTKPKTKANATRVPYRQRQATVPRQHPQFRSCANIHSYVYPCAAGYNAVYCLGRTEHTCCIVFARANRQRCCEFVMTASWSISKGMGTLREL